MQHLRSITLLNVTKVQWWVSGLRVKHQNNALLGNVNMDTSPYFLTWMSNCSSLFKVSEYPFKQNKNTLKNIKVLLYTHFYNIYLNVLRPSFFYTCNLPFSHFPNTKKKRVKVGPKTDFFSFFMSSFTDRIAVFSIFLSLIFSQRRDKQNRARIFFF